MLNISKVYVFNKERIRALKALKEELLGRNAMDLQQDRPKQQQKGQPARGKGRPKETLKDMMINDTNGEKLQKLHAIMKDKRGKGAALIILAAVKKGWLQKPTYPQVAGEFGDIGAQQGFTAYLHEEKFTKDEIEGIIKSLD